MSDKDNSQWIEMTKEDTDLVLDRLEEARRRADAAVPDAKEGEEGAWAVLIAPLAPEDGVYLVGDGRDEEEAREVAAGLKDEYRGVPLFIAHIPAALIDYDLAVAGIPQRF